MDTIETVEYKGFTIDICQDFDPEDPREWDNIGTMVCFHKRYTLGDKHNYKQEDFSSWSDLKDKIISDNPSGVVFLPIYLLDHSCLVLSIEPFNDPWDSGQVGFIYVSNAKIAYEYGNDPLAVERALNYLRGEIETYSQYLNGEVYGYIAKCNAYPEVKDSCWGYFGYDNCMECAKESVDSMAETVAKDLAIS